MARFIQGVGERLGWETHLRPFLFKQLPSGLSWKVTFGSLCVLLFAVQVVTGIFLAMYYVPSPDQAYQSVHYVAEEVSGGALLVGIHHWTAGAMVLLVFLHMVATFFAGAFKRPRELTWIFGVLLLFLTLGFGFTGYLLPWDQKAFWATVVGTNTVADIPLIGEAFMRLARGGASVSGLTLTRFYSLHVLTLPALTVLVAAAHIYLVRVHGMTEPSAEPVASSGSRYRFFPEHIFRSSLAFTLVFGTIFLLAAFVPVAREDIAGTVDPNYLARPEWYYLWLFQLLTYFSGSTEVIGTIVIPTLLIALLLGAPFIDRSPHRQLKNRPVAAGVAISGLVAILYLSWTGWEGARPTGKMIALPDRQLSPKELAGFAVFQEKECAYCHHVMGRGGRKEGPDLANVVRKGRSREWLGGMIRDPQAISSWTTMPRYDLETREVEALIDFLVGLDFEENGSRILRGDQLKREVAQRPQ